jgi:hypothetical protein
MLDSPVRKMMAPPENCEKMRFTSAVSDIQVVNGQAVASHS